MYAVSKFHVRGIVLVTVIWRFIDRTQIVKNANIHNILNLSTLQKFYLNLLSDPIVQKGATENKKLRSTGTVRYMV